MKLYCVLVLVTVVRSNDAGDSQIQNTGAELAKLIHFVTDYGVQDSEVDEWNSQDSYPFDLDYYSVRNTSPHLQTIMALLQSSYDPTKAHETPGVRVHVIRNPGVLKEYQKTLKKTKPHQFSYENYDDDENKSNNYKNILLDQRRNAVFRFESASVERATNTNIDKKSSENHKFKDEQDDRNHDVDVYVKDVQDIRKKGREDDLKQDNAWDVITKRYDWDEPMHKDYDSHKKRKESQQKRFKKDDSHDDWNNKITKQDDWDKKPKHNWNEMDKPRKRDSSERKPKKDFKRPKKTKNFDSYENPKKMKKDSYERPKKPKKYDSFERPKVKNEISNRDVTEFKITTQRWKSQPKPRKKKYVPQISSYYSKPKSKKRDNFEGGGGFFGRTPIPYVGKHGIYVD